MLRDLLGALASSGNRFVLTTRYTARAHRLLRDAPAQFEIIHVAPLTPAEIRATLPAPVDGAGAPSRARARTRTSARATSSRGWSRRSPTAGPSYARLIADTSATLDAARRVDPGQRAGARCSRRTARSTAACRFCYELRLHRARGYGALKAILECSPRKSR